MHDKEELDVFGLDFFGFEREACARLDQSLVGKHGDCGRTAKSTRGHKSRADHMLTFRVADSRIAVNQCCVGFFARSAVALLILQFAHGGQHPIHLLAQLLAVLGVDVGPKVEFAVFRNELDPGVTIERMFSPRVLLQFIGRLLAYKIARTAQVPTSHQARPASSSALST